MIQVIGKHKVRHGDVHNETEIQRLVGPARAGIFYSDPPWGEGNIKFWDTMNRKMNNINTTTNNFDVDVFVTKVLTYAKRYTDGFVVIEYGQRWTQKVINIAQSVGLIYCAQVEEVYGGQNLPVDVIVFHTNKKIDLDLSSLHHQKGYKAVKMMFALLKTYGLSNQLGMDLCCGMGYTAQACIDNGLAFIGNELNEARLAKTIKRLNKDAK